MSPLFGQPSALLLLLVLPALELLLRQADQRNTVALARFGDPELLARSAPLPSRASGRRRRGLGWLGLAAVIVALARPEVGRTPSALARTGRDLVVALDLSRSMTVSDVGDTRLERAKALAWQLGAAHRGDRIGLVIFGGAGFLSLPPTSDLGTFQLFLEHASPGDIGDPATNIAAALRAAERALRKAGAPGSSRAVILLTDGERTVGPLDAILDLYRHARLPVFAVGIGTESGGRVPGDSATAEGPWHLDHIGRPIVSRLVEGDLQKVAIASGGLYARWDDARALEQVTTALAALEARRLADRSTEEPEERYQWPLGLGLLALLLARRGRRQAPALRRGPADPRFQSAAALLLLAMTLSCTPMAHELARAQELYQQGHYLEAYEAYQKVLAQQGGPEVRFNSGDALYRMRRYPEAAKTWRDALAGASDPLREDAYYNMGTAFIQASEDVNPLSNYLGRALDAFEEALVLNPGDAEAKWNLELALRKRGDIDQTGSRGLGGRAQYGVGQQKEEGYEPDQQTAVGAMAGGGMGGDEGESVEELDESQARSLLEAIERQQLSTHEGRPSRTQAGGDRDW